MVNAHDDPTRVKIVVSVGLLVVAVCAALCMVVFQRMAPHIERQLGIESAEQFVPGGVSYDTLKNAPLSTLPVDRAAAQEIKKQTQTGPAQPGTPQPSGMVATPTASKYSLAIFVGTDAQSNQVLEWFNRDRSLQTLRTACNFQAYTKDNPLYKSRFANVVPPDQFPAVLMTDPAGGHVYAAGGEFLPNSAQALYDDLKTAHDLQKAIVTPSERERASQVGTGTPDCPDGNCKPFDPPRVPLLNPDREPLFPLRPKPDTLSIESLLYWLWNPGEAVLALCCAALFAVLLIVVLLKVVRS